VSGRYQAGCGGDSDRDYHPQSLPHSNGAIYAILSARRWIWRLSGSVLVTMDGERIKILNSLRSGSADSIRATKAEEILTGKKPDDNLLEQAGQRQLMSRAHR